MNKGKKLILAVLCGLPADNKIARGAMTDPEAATDMLACTRVDKADFLTQPGEDDPFFAHEQTWDNLPRIAAMLRKQGEEFSVKDMATPIVGSMSPLRYAERCKKLEKLFAPEVWRGRRQEMESLFFHVMKTERDKLNYTELRRAVAATTGDLVPEDRLKTYGLEPLTVRTNIRNGRITELKADLARRGDHFRKEYVFLLDSAGDNLFEFKDSFDNMDSWLAELEAHGERMTKADFLFTVGDQKTPLQHAINHGQLAKVFRARVWQGHAAEMLELYEHLPQADRAKIDIGRVLSELKEAEYSAKISVGADIDLKSLTRVLNEHERDQAGFYPVHALGFERVWQNMESIRATLASHGESLSLSHLRRPAGAAGDSVMMLAARTGNFGHVLAIAAESGERLTLDDLTVPGPGGKAVIEILAAKGDIKPLFRAEDWVGRGHELLALWDKVPEDKRKTIDFEAIHGRVNMLTLRQRFGGAAPRPQI